VNTFSLILDTGAVLLILGVFLAVYNLFLTGMEVVMRVWRRVFVSWAHRRMRDLGIVKENEYRARTELDVKRLALVIVAPALALAVRDWLLSPIVLGCGLLVFWWVNFQERQGERSQVNEDAEMAALQMRSLMQVDHSLLGALNGITLPDGLLKRSLQKTIARLQMHQPPDQAARALEGLPGAVTARLVALIANSARITDEVQSSLLVALEQEAHRQKLLRSKMSQTLALVRGTIRLLQGVVAAALVFVLLSPTWRDFFLQDIPHRTLLTTLLLCAVVASLYFEYEVYQLGSGEAF